MPIRVAAGDKCPEQFGFRAKDTNLTRTDDLNGATSTRTFTDQSDRLPLRGQKGRVSRDRVLLGHPQPLEDFLIGMDEQPVVAPQATAGDERIRLQGLASQPRCEDAKASDAGAPCSLPQIGRLLTTAHGPTWSCIRARSIDGRLRRRPVVLKAEPAMTKSLLPVQWNGCVSDRASYTADRNGSSVSAGSPPVGAGQPPERTRNGMAGRVIPPVETWKRIEPFLGEIGITRVANITGLDRIGIPVWIAVRPNSRLLSVSQGKGLDTWSARVSAAMESIEAALAERPELPLQFATLSEISETAQVVDVKALPQVRNSLFGTNRRLYWANATDWAMGASVWVPYDVVHVDATVPRLPGSGGFQSGSNGLASGNVIEEAILHGLCELIERDALAIWSHATPSQRRVNLATIQDPTILQLLDAFRSAGIMPIIWDMTSDIRIAAFHVVILDEMADPITHPFPAARGSGCHPNRTVALARALTEAAQSRLTVISGARDDFGRAHYRTTQSAAALSYFRDLAHAGDQQTNLADVSSWYGNTLTDEIRHVGKSLEDVGLNQMLYVDLSRPDFPVSVVRTVVPGLEGSPESPSYVTGPRVRSSLKGNHT